MRRFWTLFILLSFLMIQFHGLSHTLEGQGDTHHSCTVCENQSQNLAIGSNNSKIKIASQTGIKFSFAFDVFIAKINLLAHTPPRAPPV